MIANAVIGKIEQNSSDQLDQLLAKWVAHFKLFSIDNHYNQLPELLGHALWTGWHLGREFKTKELQKQLEDLKKELDKRNFDDYFI